MRLFLALFVATSYQGVVNECKKLTAIHAHVNSSPLCRALGWLEHPRAFFCLLLVAASTGMGVGSAPLLICLDAPQGETHPERGMFDVTVMR